MPFSSKDIALIKNLYQFKKYSSLEILTEFLKINCKRESLDILLKRFWKQKARTRGIREAD